MWIRDSAVTWTTVPAKWFPKDQRATAVGIITLGNLIGTALGMVLPPALMEAGVSIASFQLFFGMAAAVSAILFITLSREEPDVPPAPDADRERALVLDGLKQAFASSPFRFTLAVSFIGLGIFNGVSTWIEAIIRPRGFDATLAGTMGAVMIAGGLAGAVILPALSDRVGRRQPFLYIAVAGAIPGVLGLALTGTPFLLLLSSGVMGFFLVSALPVAMQYAAEVTAPVPEGTSNGLIQLFGQGAVVFVYAMEAMKGQDGSFTLSLVAAAGMLVLGIFFVFRMKDQVRAD